MSRIHRQAVSDARQRAQHPFDQSVVFHEIRLDQLRTGDSPTGFRGDTLLLLHLIPDTAFQADQQFALEVGGLREYEEMLPVLRDRQPLNYWKHTAEGLAHYAGDRDEPSSYTQISRNGIIESANSDIFVTYDDSQTLPNDKFELVLTHGVRNFLRFYEEVELAERVYFCMTLAGVGEYTFSYPEGVWSDDRPFSQNDVGVVPILIDEFDLDVLETRMIMENPIDIIWNSVGVESSNYYDEEDGWRYEETSVRWSLDD